MQATVKIIVKLKDPTDTWENTMEVTFPTVEALVGHSVQRIGKIIGERGIIQASPTDGGGLRTHFIPYDRIIDIVVDAQPSLIEASTDIEAAKKDAEITKSLTDGIISFPGKHGAN